MGHVHFRVRDVEETIGFYRDVLGMGLMAQLGPPPEAGSSGRGAGAIVTDRPCHRRRYSGSRPRSGTDPDRWFSGRRGRKHPLS